MIEWPKDRHGNILDSLTKMTQEMGSAPLLDRLDEIDELRDYLDALCSLSGDNGVFCINGVMLAQLLQPALKGLNKVSADLGDNVEYLKKVYFT